MRSTGQPLARLGRRRILLAGAALLAGATPSRAEADDRLPLPLQAQLIGRLVTFDRNFARRAGAVVRVLVVDRAGSAESSLEGAAFVRALSEQRSLGGVPARIERSEYEGATALAARCRAQQLAVVYLARGLETESSAIAAALAGGDVLSVGASARHAENGCVIGFALEEARPRVVLNLRRARAQSVDFKAELLKIARIVDG